MSAALDLLHTVFGYSAFRGAQSEIINHVVNGGDALVLMPTGGGKSLCYQIPALLRPGCAIVVSPLIALMQDQVDALLQVGVQAAYLNSSLSFDAVLKIERRLFSEETPLDLLYVAPERLLTERFLNLLDRLNHAGQLALFSIDEAHCVSQWGHDFRPEYIQLSTLHQRYPNIPRIALTATADELTRNEIRQRLGLLDARVFISSFDRPNIRYTIVERDKPRQQLLDLINTHRHEAGIVYCLSRKKVDETAIWLQQQGINALPYHAGMTTEQRRIHQQRFVREEGIVMVATIAFGMGIDKPDVRFVAHLDLPKSLEAYYQETGRAGRDGEPAIAWMTYGINDVIIHSQRIDESAAPDEQKRIERQKLDAMLAYCESAGCRRTVLLNYFGEASNICNNCDTCLDPPELWDGTIAAQKLLSAAIRSGQRYGAAHLIDILRGKHTEKISQCQHDQLPTFGIGKELDESAWRGIARQLLAAGLLHADPQRYGGLVLTEAARPVLRGETTLMLRRPVARTKSNSAAARTRAQRAMATMHSGHASLPSSATHTTRDDLLFQTLRDWRAQCAQAQETQAFIILHDKTLHEIVAQRPASLEELSHISGIGKTKLERYGVQILDVLDKASILPAE